MNLTHRSRILSASLLSLALAGCSAAPDSAQSSEASSEAHPPATHPSEESKSVPDPKSAPISFALLKSRRLEGSSAERWLPGESLRIEVGVLNRGQPLMNYPSVVLESLDPGLEIVGDATHVLYGLPAGDEPYPLIWTLKCGPQAKAGQVYRLALKVYAENMDAGQGRPPLAEGTCQVTLGAALAR